MRYNNVRTGFLTGLVMPLLGLFLYALFTVTVSHPGWELGFFLKHVVFGIRGNIAPVLSLSLLADVVLFFAFDHKRMLLAMRGVIGAMLAYGAVIVLLLLLWGRDFI